jgi:hypothetical protein
MIAGELGVSQLMAIGQAPNLLFECYGRLPVATG